MILDESSCPHRHCLGRNDRAEAICGGDPGAETRRSDVELATSRHLHRPEDLALPVAAPVSRRPIDEPAVVRPAWKLFEEDP